MRIETRYIANDGTVFDNDVSCKLHELRLGLRKCIGEALCSDAGIGGTGHRGAGVYLEDFLADSVMKAYHVAKR